MLESFTNPDLEVSANNIVGWNKNSMRRQSFRNLHKINRYGLTIRSDQVLKLRKNINYRIEGLSEVRRLAGSEIFCGMAVVKQQEILFEKYAKDFAPDLPHTIMSISKTTLNLIVGDLVSSGKLDLGKRVKDYLPEIGSGYAQATVQQVMDMDVVNDYSEDYSDPYSISYAHETAMGWRLQGDNLSITQHDYLPRIKSNNVSNPGGEPNYKSANTDVLTWIAERVSGIPIREWLIQITESAGFEQAMFVTTDRTGLPVLCGGISLTLRDLARYGLLFARLGMGVADRQVGNAQFLNLSRSRASLEYPEPRRGMYYSNQLYTNKIWVGHGGWGGQFMLVNLKTGTVCVFLSVLESDGAHDEEYSTEIVNMLADISEQF